VIEIAARRSRVGIFMRVVAFVTLLAVASPVAADMSVRGARELGYGRGGYIYYVVDGNDGAHIADGPIGSNGRWREGGREGADDCPLQGRGWPANTEVHIQQSIQLAKGAHVQLGFAFDNDILEVDWNAGLLHGEQRHEGCAVRDSLVIDVPPEQVREGLNILNVRVRDRGVVAYYDHRITIR
jgi:hypothetical protein